MTPRPREPRLLREPLLEGTYRVRVSDGVQHHEVGTVRGEWTEGPKRGRRRRWWPSPPGAAEPLPYEHTLGEACRALKAAWERARPRRGHGLPGLFVVVEGGDGAGKSTLVERLVLGLLQAGHPVASTAEPSDSPVGVLLREALAGRHTLPGGAPLPPAEYALLYAADRVHHLHAEVLPALAAGKVVVCSRYTLSSLAYQGPALGLEWVAELNARVPLPDLVLFLELPPEEGLSRVTSQRQPDSFEVPDRAREAALGYARGLRYLEEQGVQVERLDATQPPSHLARAALELVLGRLEKLGRSA